MGKELDAPKGGAMEVDAAGAGAPGKKAGETAAPAGPPPVPAVLAAAASLMDRAAKAKDVRGLPNRALRLAAGARARFDGPGLTEFLEGAFAPADEARGVLLGAVALVRRCWWGLVAEGVRGPPWRGPGGRGGGEGRQNGGGAAERHWTTKRARGDRTAAVLCIVARALACGAPWGSSTWHNRGHAGV